MVRPRCLAPTLTAQDAESIPVVASLSDIVVPAALDAQERRLKALLERFEEQHGVPASFVARAPGRVVRPAARSSRL